MILKFWMYVLIVVGYIGQGKWDFAPVVCLFDFDDVMSLEVFAIAARGDSVFKRLKCSKTDFVGRFKCLSLCGMFVT